MGAITEAFANLTEKMLAERRTPAPGIRRSTPSEILLSRLLIPLMPSAVRCGPGVVVDIKDRQVGPFDIVAASESFPGLSDGAASIYAVDGVVLVVQARNWAEQDLTEFAKASTALKQLERKSKIPPVCLAVSFEPLVLDQVMDFLVGQSGASVDGVLTLGEHAILRNTLGWYGDPQRIPFVSERGGALALKSFAFFLLQLAQSFNGGSFAMTDYQHL